MKKMIILLAAAGLAFALVVESEAGLVGQLGILDLTENPTNPATGVAWAEGDQYHLAFITSNVLDATSTDINDYDAFVQSVADGGSSVVATAGAVSWKAMVSTPSVEAKTHLGVATGTGFAMFDLLSRRLADNYPDMLDSGWKPFDILLTVTEDGVEQTAEKRTWTGSNGDLTVNTGRGPLGDADGTAANGKMIGESGVWAADTYSTTQEHHMYAMSEPLTIMSEGGPATPGTLIIGR
jgi:hypothetical protein